MDSPTSSSTWSLAPTPTGSESETLQGAMVTSRSDSTTLVEGGRSSSAQAQSVAPPSGPVRVTSLDVSSWRPRYPVIGQFAMTASEEVIAAGPDGLFSFKRVNDHVSKPWSKPRPFPGRALTSSSVSGIALYESQGGKRLDVFCVSNGSLYSFSRVTKEDAKAVSSFVTDSSPPLDTYRVSGTPCTATIKESSYMSGKDRYSLVVPSQSGGLLHTSTTGKERSYYSSGETEWEPVDHVATRLGIISAVTIATLNTSADNYSSYTSQNKLPIVIVAVCIAQGKLHSVEGPFTEPRSGSYSSGPGGWKGETTDKIHHPREVTGNPVLLQEKLRQGQLDLLVPSAAGGIFHFVRTPSTPDEWHMIGRIGFPSGLPAAGSLAFFQPKRRSSYGPAILGAALEIGGRLYTTASTEGHPPWYGCQLYPLERPGPSYY